MTRVLHRPRTDEAQIPCASAAPLPVGRSRPIATTLPPLPLGAPARAVGVIAELRAADVRLGMRPPVAPLPLPTRTLIERLAFVSTAMHDDYARHLDTLAVIDDISAALTEHPEALGYTAHPGIRLGLRRAHAELAALIPLAVSK